MISVFFRIFWNNGIFRFYHLSFIHQLQVLNGFLQGFLIIVHHGLQLYAGFPKQKGRPDKCILAEQYFQQISVKYRLQLYGWTLDYFFFSFPGFQTNLIPVNLIFNQLFHGLYGSSRSLHTVDGGSKHKMRTEERCKSQIYCQNHEQNDSDYNKYPLFPG